MADPGISERDGAQALRGSFIELTPLAAAHGDALFAALDHAERDLLTAHMVERPPTERAAFDAWLDGKIVARDRRYFACIDIATAKAGGFFALMRDDPAHRCVEIGDVLFTPKLRRRPGATEAVYLLARHVFEHMGYRRFEWKCDSRNAASRQAALRFGFTFEGVFRQHMLVRGESRDSVWLSMLDGEWPARRAAFESWLAPENFEGDGRQRTALSAINGAGGS